MRKGLLSRSQRRGFNCLGDFGKQCLVSPSTIALCANEPHQDYKLNTRIVLKYPRARDHVIRATEVASAADLLQAQLTMEEEDFVCRVGASRSSAMVPAAPTPAPNLASVMTPTPALTGCMHHRQSTVTTDNS